MRKELLRYAPNFQNDCLVVLHRAEGCREPLDGARTSIDRAPQLRGCYSKHIHAALDRSNFQKAREQRREAGRSSDQEMMQGPYALQIPSAIEPACYLLIAQVLASTVTIPAISLVSSLVAVQ